MSYRAPRVRLSGADREQDQPVGLYGCDRSATPCGRRDEDNLRVRLTLDVCMATAMVAAPSCDSGRPQEELRAELATFPAPSHLVLVQTEETGPSSCVAGDCPEAIRYYLSERSLAVTCEDMRRASDDWDLPPVDWTTDEGGIQRMLGCRTKRRTGPLGERVRRR